LIYICINRAPVPTVVGGNMSAEIAASAWLVPAGSRQELALLKFIFLRTIVCSPVSGFILLSLWTEYDNFC